MNRNKLLVGWALFVGIIFSSIIIDFIIRKNSNNFYETGLNESIWFALHTVAFICLASLVCEIGKIKSYIRQLIINIIPAVFVYLVLIYSYILGLGDRKSTRLNSSHVRISYAVFCLKKIK